MENERDPFLALAAAPHSEIDPELIRFTVRVSRSELPAGTTLGYLNQDDDGQYRLRRRMRLSWNEIRIRAETFAREWEDAHYEKGETQSFYNDFFEVFGVKRRSVARYEEHVKKLNDKSGFVDLYWPGVLLVEQKSAGRDLSKAYDQAGEYFDSLKVSDQPRYIMVSDFQTFALTDLDERETLEFDLAQFADHVEKFGFILGLERRTFEDQDPVNIQASELVGNIHDSLEDSGYVGDDLERFLVRIVFCLFADDTGIFEPRDSFLDLLEERTSEDGSDLGAILSQLFQVLDTPEDSRLTTIDEDLDRFPYINGDLFTGSLRIPAFTSKMRLELVEACRFDWSGISPAIFGSLFQSVMNKEERRKLGAHYTTEKNILKVVGPLFLDDLRSEFEGLRRRRDTRRRNLLRKFHEKLGELRFLDPACGCGNFLIITYRELRLLEIEVLKEIREYGDPTRRLDTSHLSLIDVDQFYGIEIGEFPARIAETAMWMMDHIMNNRLSVEFGQSFARIPLSKSPHILHADALEADWEAHLPPDSCSFVLGNPPFIGAKYQTPNQREQLRTIARLGKTGGTLDYVAAWFIRAATYIRDTSAKVGFVATNSITQGEQVGQLWPVLFDKHRLEIAFAHRTFAWGSDARGKAHVHVVIIGLVNAREEARFKRLYSYKDLTGDPSVSTHLALSPYLVDAQGLPSRHFVVHEAKRPLNQMPMVTTGVQMIDNGILTFSDDEKVAFTATEPNSEPWFRKYYGGDEFINGFHRWILYLADISSDELRDLPNVRDRVQRVRDYRGSSTRASTKRLADYPTKVGVDKRPESSVLVIPNTSSEQREYVPIGWLGNDVIANQKLRILVDPELWQFGILTSHMHMAWMRIVTGRMKSDYMYSIGVVYNTFPLPECDLERLQTIEPFAQQIIDAREKYPTSTLAELYATDLMPAELRDAHRALDRAVDRLYRRSAFGSERERVDFLFGLYERLVAPVSAAARPKPKRKRTPGKKSTKKKTRS